ncbi:hypothetical protein [Embleya sp. NBC_00896]|uniref:hypothetical protein n=1 Tax=Embleya sp. NBC_00896 TaxID=2975961 RepID=UPI002F916527|nr:hypothetical protein OG928_47795 [Embleya sp. NBC_00896]
MNVIHDVDDRARPITVLWRYNVADSSGQLQLLTEVRPLTLPEAVALFRDLRNSLESAGVPRVAVLGEQEAA